MYNYVYMARLFCAGSDEDRQKKTTICACRNCWNFVDIRGAPRQRQDEVLEYELPAQAAMREDIEYELHAQA